MSLYLPDHNAAFVHVPKCAGNWVKKILRATATVQTWATPGDYAVHPRPRFGTNRPRFVFAFIRHPQSWYESWWRCEMDRKWPQRSGGDTWHPQRCLDFARGTSNFNDWIKAVMDDEPAYVTRLYEWYLGPEGAADVDFVGRVENLVPDAVAALDMAEVKPDSSIFDTPAENVSKTPRPEWEPHLLRRMLVMEAATIRRFGL